MWFEPEASRLGRFYDHDFLFVPSMAKHYTSVKRYIGMNGDLSETVTHIIFRWFRINLAASPPPDRPMDLLGLAVYDIFSPACHP
jgi:hypothetical protein